VRKRKSNKERGIEKGEIEKVGYRKMRKRKVR